jgi:hypothetical protein
MARQTTPPGISTFRWHGGEAAFLDTPAVTRCGRVVIGRYGGNKRAGAASNEDGALVWCAGDGSWEFAVLLDAHFSSESAALVLDGVEGQRERLLAALAQPTESSFAALHVTLLALFTAPDFRAACRRVVGEASCLIFARKGAFLWWLSVGDCLGYLLHDDLARHGQFAVNARTFYEWIGARNTFDLAVPCYTAGTRALRADRNTLLLATDGLVEWGSRVYANPMEVYRHFASWESDFSALEESVKTALARLHSEQARDSATVLVWRCEQLRP